MTEMYDLGWEYPMHLGVTEAGEGEDGRMKVLSKKKISLKKKSLSLSRVPLYLLRTVSKSEVRMGVSRYYPQQQKIYPRQKKNLSL